MAIEKTIIVKADTGKAVKEINKLEDELKTIDSANKDTSKSAEDIGGGYKKASQEAVKGLDGINNSANLAGSGTSKLTTTVKGLGLSFKALGLGLIISLVIKLTDAFKSSEKVTALFSNIMTTLEIVLSEISDRFNKLVNIVYESTGGFESLSKVISGVLNIALENLKIGFNTISLAISSAQLAWEKSFFGGNDEGKIKELNEKIDQTKESINNSFETIVENGKEVYNNLGNAANEVLKGVSEFGKGLSDIVSVSSIKAAYEQSKMLNQHKKNIEEIAFYHKSLIQQYEAEIAILNKVQQNHNKSFSERIQAVKQLEVIIEKQIKAEKGQIASKLNLLRQEQKLLGFTQERKLEIIGLENELLSIEQKRKGLQEERADAEKQIYAEQKHMLESVVISEKEREQRQLSFQQSIERDAIKRIELEKEKINKQKNLDIEELERKRILYKEDTQARVDAEQEYLNKKQYLDNQLIANNIALEEYLLKKNLDANQLIIQNESLSFATRYEAIADQNKLILENTILTEEEKTAAIKANAEAREKIDQQEFAAKQQVLGAISDALSAYSSLLSQETAEGKFLAAAASLINTYQGITASLRAGGIVGITQAATVGAIGFKAVQDIYKVDVPNSSSGSLSPSMDVTSSSMPPIVNMVGTSDTNQLAEFFAEQEPQKAYVTSAEVSSKQALDRSVESSASFGF